MRTEYTYYDVPHLNPVQDLIVQSAGKYADKIALEDLKETPIPKVTYRSLLKNILKFGVAPKDLGVKERRHIAIIGDNRVKSGKNVFPEEIEDVLNRSSFILEFLVYGEEDAKLKEIIAAQIVADAEAFIELSELKGVKITPELLHTVVAEEIRKTNEQLSSYKQIKKFKVRDQESEKTTTQKIKRDLVQKN